MLIWNNMDGVRYFIYVISNNNNNNNKLPYIDTDLRKIIWNYTIEPPYILCYLNNDIYIKLNILI